METSASFEAWSAPSSYPAKLEKRWLEKFNQLTTTLDKFLKRFTDFEEEFKFSQGGPQARKAVTRDKLGVSLD